MQLLWVPLLVVLTLNLSPAAAAAENPRAVLRAAGTSNIIAILIGIR